MRLAALIIFLSSTTSLYSQICAPAAAVLHTIEELQTPEDMRLSAGERAARKTQLVSGGLKASPSDVFLHEEYQRIRLDGMEINRGDLIEEYEKLLLQHPEEPAYLYLAALAQVGRNTSRSISLLDHAIKREPSFGLPYLLLAEIYSATAYSDPVKVNHFVDQFESVCPDSVRAFSTLRWSKDASLIGQTAARIRRNLNDRVDPEALAAYSVVWSLEAAQGKSDEQSENIARIKQDMVRLFASDVPRNAAWLTAIKAIEFIQDGLNEYAVKARREIAEQYPYSAAAITEAHLKARGPDDYPSDGTPDEVAAYWRREWQASLPLARKFPGSLPIAAAAARAIVQDPAATGAEIHDTMTLFLAAAKSDPDGYRTLPPQPIEVAQDLAERGIFEDIPELVFAGLAAIDRGFSPDIANDVRGQTSAGLRQQRDRMYFWGYNALTEAYIRLGRHPSVKDLLIQQEDILNRLRSADAATTGDQVRLAEDQAHFWYLKGLFAEAENSKLDALIAYRSSVSSFPPRRPRPDRRDKVMQSAQRLWKALGGTALGWNDWAAQSSLRNFDAGSGSSNAWTKLPADFVFNDVLGRRYTPKDLASKTTLVTLWASWCGPCRAELPYFEKLYRQFADRNDIVLLAFNVDDDVTEMDKALSELKLTIPSVYATPFVYSILPQIAIPANWVITPAKTELLSIEASALPEWQMKTAEVLENSVVKQ